MQEEQWQPEPIEEVKNDVLQDPTTDFGEYSTPCADNCPGKALYPKKHVPHYPLYPNGWC